MTSATTIDASPQPAPDAPPGRSPGRRRRSLFFRALRLPSTKIGLVLMLLVFGAAFLGPLFSPHSSTSFVGVPFAGPGHGLLLGTDNLGRDVLSRVLDGGHQLLLLSLAATALGVGGGAVIGVVAAYRRGFVDEALMRTNDVLLAFPQIVLALLFLSIIGPKVWLLILMVGIGHLPRTARVVRGAATSVVERDFVKAAESVGIARWRIMLVEIIPNVTGTLAVEFGLRLTYSIGLIAGLSFLGLGIQPPNADWGLMINENRIALTVQPWPVIIPTLAIAILTVGTNLVTDGLARASAGSGQGVEA